MTHALLQTLQHLGLSDKESSVYLASLEIGSAPVQLIALKAGINRPTAYVIIDNLLKLGLMSRHEQGKKTLFAAETPERLERLIERQHEQLAEKEAELKSVFPDLKAIYNLSENKPVVKYYEGRAGYLAMSEEYYVPKFKNSTIYAFVPLDIVITNSGTNLVTELAKRRIELGIKLQVIYSSSKIPSQLHSSKELRDVRWISASAAPFDGQVVIHPEWGFWIHSYAKGFQALAVGDKAMANTLKQLFDLAWGSAKKIK